MVKSPLVSAGDMGSSLGLGKSPGRGNDNPPHYSCRENPMYRGVLPAAVHAVTKSQVWLNTLTQVLHICGIIWYLSFSIWFISVNMMSSYPSLWRQGQDREKAGSLITLLNSCINPLPKAHFTSEHFGYLVNIFHLLFKHICAYIFYYLHVKRW